jgi:hypothetical protein
MIAHRLVHNAIDALGKLFLIQESNRETIMIAAGIRWILRQRKPQP